MHLVTAACGCMSQFHYHEANNYTALVLVMHICVATLFLGDALCWSTEVTCLSKLLRQSFDINKELFVIRGTLPLI